MDILQEINELTASNRIDEALKKTDEVVSAGAASPQLHIVRGRLLWRVGERHRAMTAFAEAAALDPDGPGAMLLDHARDIDNFYHHDRWNP